MNKQNQATRQDPLIHLLFDDGLQNALPRIAEILMNAAMMLEREKHIGTAPDQLGATDRNRCLGACRSAGPRGRNGFPYIVAREVFAQ